MYNVSKFKDTNIASFDYQPLIIYLGDTWFHKSRYCYIKMRIMFKICETKQIDKVISRPCIHTFANNFEPLQEQLKKW